MDAMTVKTSYGHVNLYRAGAGKKALVLLHGGGCDSALLSWREVMEQTPADYTVYALDLLGYGKSDRPSLCGDRFYDSHIDCVRQVAESLGLNSFLLAGLSMGGAIAAGYALKYPQKVLRLFPVDSWGFTARLPLHRFSHWYIQKTNMTKTQYRWLAKSRALAKWSVAYSLIGDKSLITGALVDEVIDACKTADAGLSMQDYQRSSIGPDGARPYYTDALAALDLPVVFVTGEKDPLVPLRDIQKAAGRAQSGKLYVLRGCKHWSVKERPREFWRIVRENS